jgi:hypothetical protein
MAATADDLFLRYNVNGIELNTAGFNKLSQEIDLRVVTCSLPELQPRKIKFYTGKFPTVTGKYQRLVIREALIPEVSPDKFKMVRFTSRKYYEVCSHPKLYEYVRKN